MAVFIAFADGASRGNPGPSAWGGSIVTQDGVEVWSHGERLPVAATNNVAEYAGAIGVATAAKALGAHTLHLRMDSQLVIRQLQGAYRVRAPHLLPFYNALRDLLATFPHYTLEHIPREWNRRADQLANQALDGRV